MSSTTHPKPLQQIAARTKYPVEAFHFVRRALDFTVHRLHKNPEAMSEEERHVSGRQLCYGLRDYAQQQYGLLAQMVLARWRITRTEDFGAMVFAMVEGGLMQATEHDSVRDFDGVFIFADAFSTDVPVEHIPLDMVVDEQVEQEQKG